MNTDLAQIETELLEKQATFTPLGLVMPEDMGLDGWASIGKKLCRAGHMIQWWLGDWAAFGERHYGQLKEFADLNELDYGALRNLAWVSSKVELSRRRDNLDWSFHQEVAALPPQEQDRWLESAQVEGISKAELRSRIRLAKGDRCALDRDGPAIKSALKSCEDLAYWLGQRPPEFWTEDRKLAWRNNLDPIVQVYHSLA
jgi:hypothetical protein